MRQLLESDNRNAALAVEMFCYSVSKFIAAMAVALDGLDLLVFTAGIEEHAAAVRSGICSRLRHLGIVLDERANQKSSDIISVTSTCLVRVIPTDEDLQIARHCFRLADQNR